MSEERREGKESIGREMIKLRGIKYVNNNEDTFEIEYDPEIYANWQRVVRKLDEELPRFRSERYNRIGGFRVLEDGWCYFYLKSRVW